MYSDKLNLSPLSVLVEQQLAEAHVEKSELEEIAANYQVNFILSF